VSPHGAEDVIARLSTYLPLWSARQGRQVGPDEDALTMAVEAGRAALEGVAPDEVSLVVLVTRDLPLMEGGNAAALLGGLGVPRTTDVIERVGAAPAMLDALSAAANSTLVIGADVSGPAGAAAAWSGPGGTLAALTRVHRSLPLRARGQDGVVHEDEDPRLQRERGVRVSLEASELPGKPVSVAGLSSRDATTWCEGRPPDLPTLGASAPVFALAALAEQRSGGIVAAVDQATVSCATWEPGTVTVCRLERPAQELPARRPMPGPEMKLSFAAYDRAFDAKLRWEAGSCPACGTLAFPSRFRCLGCGAEGDSTLVPLPRTGTVYTATTIHVPVPGLASPYTLAVVELDGVDVRALVPVTDTVAATAEIGQPGRLVFRRMATRSGISDYGYAFAPSGGA
jgi:uncharacterized OB-fold protein